MAPRRPGRSGNQGGPGGLKHPGMAPTKGGPRPSKQSKKNRKSSIIQFQFAIAKQILRKVC